MQILYNCEETCIHVLNIQYVHTCHTCYGPCRKFGHSIECPRYIGQYKFVKYNSVMFVILHFQNTSTENLSKYIISIYYIFVSMISIIVYYHNNMYCVKNVKRASSNVVEIQVNILQVFKYSVHVAINYNNNCKYIIQL